MVAIEFTSLGNELPKYTGNIRQKISDVRGAGKGGALENVQRAIEQLKEDIQKKEEEPRTKIKPKRRKLRKNISRSIRGKQIFDAVLISSGTQLALLLHPHVSWLCPLRPPPGSARRHLQALTLSTTVISG